MKSSLSSQFGRLGRGAHSFFAEVSRITRLAQQFFYWAFFAPIEGKKGFRRILLSRQLVFVGNESLLIVSLVACSVGAVLALQAAYQLNQFGAILYTGALVNVSMARELGPVMTAIVLAGRVGASITAEIGTMKVQEEVDALITMGIPPIPFLIVPRILAMAIMGPCLTIVAVAVGIGGGFLIGHFGLNIEPHLYLQEAFKALVHKDLWTGLAKSAVFAVIVSVIACYTGLNVKGGADGVGRATTQCVVLSIISVILADCLCTALFYYVF